MSQTVLVLEDDADIAELVSLHLKVMGNEVVKGTSLEEGFRVLSERKIDAVVLDRGLDDGDGMTLCQQLRHQHNGVPILILTAMDSESDMVEGFESGADDYLAKPFSVIEFQARIRALMRRAAVHNQWHHIPAEETDAVSDELSVGSLLFNHLEISPETHSVTLGGKTIDLTPTEFSLLCCLAKRPERVFSKDELLSRVWNTDYDGYRHTVCCAVNRLRSKLERDPDMPKYIHTVWGVGYKFREAATLHRL
ncbi:DNA-binding response regulator [Enterovibrio norvegicus FF-454]|uniref:Phosphate regulon transcriptional regulatory protein PhoB n=1 Tax=Enterovibrio norvegicus FF-454 TaxID=1185651 RepID=A0A1E5C8J0_9GAMM|nr:response regulator transcription factor [Enterovibrio norvegicus]OEE61828.1 DNA-binding response regulator [Enterovibrio norvegicus FF-454]